MGGGGKLRSVCGNGRSTQALCPMPVRPDEISAVAYASQRRQVTAKSRAGWFEWFTSNLLTCSLLALGIAAPLLGPFIIYCFDAAILSGSGPSTAQSFLATAIMSVVALTGLSFLGSLAGVRSSKYCGSESHAFVLGFSAGVVALAFVIAIVLLAGSTLNITIPLAMLYLSCGYITPFLGRCRA